MPRQRLPGAPSCLASGASPISRRRFLAGAGAGSAVLPLLPAILPAMLPVLPALSAALPRRAMAAGEEVRFGLTPVFLSSDLELLSKLQGYLSAALARPVTLVKRRTYQEITALLLSGQLDAAWICGYPFVQYRERLSLLAVPVWRGKPLYQSYLIVHEDRAVDGIRGLRGDIHAFSDPDSNSGHLVTQAALAEMQETADRFFRKSFFTYSHRNVVRAVASGLAESGSVDGYVWEVLSEIDPALTAKTRVIRKSEWLGFPPVACNRTLSRTPLAAAISQALTQMHRDPAGQDVLHLLRLDGFSKEEPALFDSIAQKYELVRSMA